MSTFMEHDSECYIEHGDDRMGNIEVGDKILMTSSYLGRCCCWWTSDLCIPCFCQKIKNVDDENGRICHQHLTSQTSVTNIDVALDWGEVIHRANTYDYGCLYLTYCLPISYKMQYLFLNSTPEFQREMNAEDLTCSICLGFVFKYFSGV